LPEKKGRVRGGGRERAAPENKGNGFTPFSGFYTNGPITVPSKRFSADQSRPENQNNNFSCATCGPFGRHKTARKL